MPKASGNAETERPNKGWQCGKLCRAHTASSAALISYAFIIPTAGGGSLGSMRCTPYVSAVKSVVFQTSSRYYGQKRHVDKGYDKPMQLCLGCRYMRRRTNGRRHDLFWTLNIANQFSDSMSSMPKNTCTGLVAPARLRTSFTQGQQIQGLSRNHQIGVVARPA